MHEENIYQSWLQAKLESGHSSSNYCLNTPRGIAHKTLLLSLDNFFITKFKIQPCYEAFLATLFLPLLLKCSMEILLHFILNRNITDRTVSWDRLVMYSDWLLACLILASLLSVTVHSSLQCQYELILHTLNWGTNLLTSCCQLCSVEAGATTRNGPQMLCVY